MDGERHRAGGLPAAGTPRPGLKLKEGSNSNALAWTASTDAKVAAYNVYRATSAGGIYAKLADKVAAITFTDSTVASGSTYFYVVTAITAANESYYSDAASTTVRYVPVPATLGAEAFTAMSGVELENSSDTGGNFTLDYRLAPDTGGWQTWVTKTSAPFAMTAGNHTLRLKSVGKEWNLSWVKVNAQ